MGCGASARSTQLEQVCAVPPSEPAEGGGFVGKGGRGHKFENGPDVAPKEGDTVLIIGGGPAGIHMASLLKQAGVVPIVIEKESRVGGKSYTIVRDGVPHDMGTCYLHPEYHVPKALLKKYGLKEAEIKPGGPTGDREIFLEDTDVHEAATYTTMTDWMYGAIEEQWAGKDYDLIPDQLSKLPMLRAIRRYQAAHKKAMGEYFRTLPSLPSKEQWELMSMTYMTFLEKNGCEALVPLLLLGHTVQGYGLLDTIPAFYGLMWITPDLLEGYLKAKQDPENNDPVLTMMKGGWSALWQRMVEQDALDVRLDHEVTQILRTADGVTVTGESRGKGNFELSGTHVFIACPFPPMAKTMALSDREQVAFSELKPFCLCTTMYEMDPADRSRPIAYWPDAISPYNKKRVPGSLMGERWNNKAVYWDQPAPHHPPPETGNPFLCETAVDVGSAGDDAHTVKQVRGGIQFLDVGVGRDEQGVVDAQLLRDRLEEALKLHGATNLNILWQKPWDYFYHYSQEALERGLLWDILAMQGNNRTFYIGASAIFESVNDVTNYNLTIFEHFFSSASGQA